MKTHSVNSSHIKSVVFDEKELHLYVEFKNGSRFDYFPFYENQLKSFLESESKGKWLHENVKNNKSIISKKMGS